jgi:hypothetical protein
MEEGFDVEDLKDGQMFFWQDNTGHFKPFRVSRDDVRQAKSILTANKTPQKELKGVVPIAWALYQVLKPVIEEEGDRPLVEFFGRGDPKVVVTLKKESMELLEGELPKSIGGVPVKYRDAAKPVTQSTKAAKPRHATYLRPVNIFIGNGNDFGSPAKNTYH